MAFLAGNAPRPTPELTKLPVSCCSSGTARKSGTWMSDPILWQLGRGGGVLPQNYTARPTPGGPAFLDHDSRMRCPSQLLDNTRLILVTSANGEGPERGSS